MAKMYLEDNNAGMDILITDENGHWWYSNIDSNGFYGDAEIYCDGEDPINEALENLRREINEGSTYSAEDWIEEYGNVEQPEPRYDGKMTIDDIDVVCNYELNSFGDLVPMGHDETEWYEV